MIAVFQQVTEKAPYLHSVFSEIKSDMIDEYSVQSTGANEQHHLVIVLQSDAQLYHAAKVRIQAS